MTERILDISQAVLAVLLMVSILLQSRGASVGLAFGGEGNVYRTKRGLEKNLFHASIVLSILFFGVSLANVLI